MKLDRNNPACGYRGKYALIKLRQATIKRAPVEGTPMVMVEESAVDFGDTDDSDFFVIRLKDKYAERALHSYANAALEDGEDEYAREIAELARLAEHHRAKRKPD